MKFMPACLFSKVHSCLITVTFAVASMVLPGQTAQITRPVMGDPSSPGLSVEPGRGALRLSIPIGGVPGEVPIPVAFAMNGTFMSTTGNSSPYYTDCGIAGTMGFGYVGYFGGSNSWLVLEDGRTFASTDFRPWAPLASGSQYASALRTVYGVTCPLTLTMNSDASLVWAYAVPLNAFSATFLNQILNHLPIGFPVTTSSNNISVVMDKDRIRIYVIVTPTGDTSKPISLPIYWGDRYGHYVTFQWTMSSSSIPPGMTSLIRVDALNQRNQGVTVRYANWGDTTTVHDLLRADFVGYQGPSVLMSGFSGLSSNTPVGFTNSFAATESPMAVGVGGMIARQRHPHRFRPEASFTTPWGDST
ncbi:MAG: hypothetical protein HY014_05200 [Acidobacteria bacterium]|nr:hypothetical protein [Acidobacteriota bacterium]MBI3487548.1 hypothetical protein [Acidobacteriota bacterium]